MPRNAEVIRQWNLLRALDAQRHGATVQELSRELGVTTHTIWRDLAALQEVGFPVTDEPDDRQTRYTLAGAPFRALGDLGVSTVELCSLYMGRAMVDAMAGTPFAPALKSICAKLEKSLPPRMRAFLDQLPALLEAKPAVMKRTSGKNQDAHFLKLLDASRERAIAARPIPASFAYEAV